MRDPQVIILLPEIRNKKTNTAIGFVAKIVSNGMQKIADSRSRCMIHFFLFSLELGS